MNSQLLNTTLASLACWTLGVLPAAAQQISKTEPAVRPQVMESYGKLPLSFEANQGQTDRSVKFLSRGSGYTLFLTEDSAVLSLHGKKANAALRMKLVGANAHSVVTGAAELPGKSNYFAVKDPKQWRTNVPTYGSVKYTGVYPGIDLVYHGNQRLLEYDFVVAPGADPRLIDLRFQGARKLSLNGDGDLVVGVGDSEIIEHAPVVYQEINGQQHTVAGRYVLRGRGRVGFRVADHDQDRPLIIDPTLGYVTYTGGTSYSAIAVDPSGNAYVTGPFQTLGTVFVTKLNSSGSELVYSTNLGNGTATGIAVDGDGNAYVTGQTSSPNFPTTPGAFQTTYGGNGDAFVAKLNANGILVYSTYIGGSGGDGASGIAVDAFGAAYVAGIAGPDFPVTPGALQSTLRASGTGCSTNGFVAKLNATGSVLVYSTYLGRSGCDQAGAIAINESGDAYITGAGLVPTTPGAYQAFDGGAFVARLNSAGSGLLYSTYLGNGAQIGTGIGVDTSDNASVTGLNGGLNGFLAKLNSSGSSLLSLNSFTSCPSLPGPHIAGDSHVAGCYAYGGFVDSIYFQSGLAAGMTGIALDAAGEVYVTGNTAFLSGDTAGFIMKVSGLNSMSVNDQGILTILTERLPTPPIVIYSLDCEYSNRYCAGGGVYSPFAVSGTHQLWINYDFFSWAPALSLTISGPTTRPATHVAALPATETSPNFLVQWSGTDIGSTIKAYSIYVSDNGAPFTPWLLSATSTRASYPGALLHNYDFYSIAVDNAGNHENPKTLADAFTHVPQIAGDANGDGKINCADLAIVKASMGKSAGQTGFNPRADVNHDGVVNVLDLAIVSQKLIPGTTCP